MDHDRIFSLWASYLAGEATPEDIAELAWAFQQDPGLRRMAELLAGTRQSPPKGISAEQEQQMLERGLQRFKGPLRPSLPVIRRISTTEMPQPIATHRGVRGTPWIAAASLLALIAGM